MRGRIRFTFMEKLKQFLKQIQIFVKGKVGRRGSTPVKQVQVDSLIALVCHQSGGRPQLFFALETIRLCLKTGPSSAISEISQITNCTQALGTYSKALRTN